MGIQKKHRRSGVLEPRSNRRGFAHTYHALRKTNRDTQAVVRNESLATWNTVNFGSGRSSIRLGDAPASEHQAQRDGCRQRQTVSALRDQLHISQSAILV